MGEFFQQLIAVDWGGLIGAAVASGVGLSFVTQILKAKWVKVPATKYPRSVSAVMAVLVGLISTISVGLELSSLASFVVFAVVAFVTSGIAYDVVRRLVQEVKHEEPVANPDNPNAVNIGTVSVDVEANMVQSISTIAKQIIAGDWGAGEERKQRLEQAGYDFSEVQSMVKKILAKK